jgi:hypothetical protein
MVFDPRTTNDPVVLASEGWMPGISYVPMVPERFAQPHTGVPLPGKMEPQGICQHVMAGHYSYALEMMRDLTVGDDLDDYASWHFSVAKDGRIAQHASIWTPCMGAGLTIYDVTPEPITALRKKYGANPNAWTVHIEHEDGAVRNPVLTEAQIAASIRAHRWVWNMCGWLKDLPRGFWWDSTKADSRLVFHSQIDRSGFRDDDPGANFPWERIMEGTFEPVPAPVPVPVPTPAPVPPITDNEAYRRGWNDHHAAALAAFESIKEPWE